MSVIRVQPINNTIGRLDPGDWPFLGPDNWIYIYPQYTQELATKLANADADIAGAINAVQQANALVDIIQASILSDIFLIPDPGYTGHITYTKVLDLIVVDFKVATTINRFRTAWSRLRVTGVSDKLPVNNRGTDFACTGAALSNMDAAHRWAAGVSEQGHLLLEAQHTDRTWPAGTWIAGQVTYHTT